MGFDVGDQYRNYYKVISVLCIYMYIVVQFYSWLKSLLFCFGV